MGHLPQPHSVLISDDDGIPVNHADHRYRHHRLGIIADEEKYVEEYRRDEHYQRYYLPGNHLFLASHIGLEYIIGCIRNHAINLVRFTV